MIPKSYLKILSAGLMNQHSQKGKKCHIYIKDSTRSNIKTEQGGYGELILLQFILLQLQIRDKLS